MKTKIHFLLIFVCCVISESLAQTNNISIDGEILNLYKRYDKRLVVAIYTNNILLNDCITSIDCEQLVFTVVNMDSISVYNTFKIVTECINKHTSEERETIFTYLQNWLSIDQALNIPLSYTNSVYVPEFAEIIDEINETRPLIEKHLVVKEQYWSSLSTSQLSCLSIEVPTYIANMPAEKQLKFLSEYFKTSYNLLKEINE